MSRELNDPLIPKSSLVSGNENSVFGSSSSSKIVIHYWTDYDSGEHLIHEMRISHNTRVLDVLLESLEIFAVGQRNVSEYCLRIANAKGKPKTSMPAFDVAQNALETGSLKFALCVKNYETGEKFERVNESSPALVDEGTVAGRGSKPESLQQSQKIRRKICCCFYSD